MHFIGRLFRNELFSLSTLFFVVLPAFNHLMTAHGAPDLSHFSVSTLFGGDLSSTVSNVASQASSAGFTLAQAGTGSTQLYINHGPIFLN